MRRHTVAYLLGTACTIALLAGCASRPQVSAQQESHRYLSRAGRSYTPPGSARDPWGPYIREASGKYDVPERWIREVMHQESGGNLYNHSGDLITSGAGAMGLMQVMPATYDDLRSRYAELGEDPYDPHNNILAGAAYLREMYDIYGAPGFLAAYNAGPGRLDDYLTRNRTLPMETRRYVAAIGPRIAGFEPQRPSPGAQYAMNAIPLDIPAGPRYPDAASQFASTVPVSTQPIVLNRRPVEVAEASRPYIKLNLPAPEPVVVAEAEPTSRYIRLSPPEPQQGGPFIKLSPQLPEPVVVAEAEPPGSFRTEPDYEPARSLLGSARRQNTEAARELEMPLPEPPAPPPEPRSSRFARRTGGNARPIEVAEFPEPPRVPSQRFAAAAELMPLGPHGHSFSLIPSANAAPLHRGIPAINANSGGWAVQVGAFSNHSLAESATESARGRAHETLGGAHVIVAGVRQGSGTLYRARLGGLSREAAAQACERLSRSRTNCIIVAPDAQR